MKKHYFVGGVLLGIAIFLSGRPAPTSALTPMPTPSPTPPSTPDPRTTLFEDDFSSPTAFGQSDDEYALIVQQNDALVITVKQPQAYGMSTLEQKFDDVTIEVDARMLNGTFDNQIGVACRVSDAGEYDFEISSDGYYRIARWDATENQLVNLVDWTRSPAINTGTGHVNRLVATCLQDQLTLSVNGHQLATVTDDQFTEGTVGIYAGSFGEEGVSVEFDNVVLLDPLEAGVILQDADALPLVSEVSIDLPYEDDFSIPSSWWHYKGEDSAAWRENDVFVINVYSENQQLFAGLGSSFDDVVIDVDVRMVDGPQDHAAFGVGCRMYPPANPEMMYQFRITATGHYKIFLHKWTGESVNLTDWIESPAIKTGAGQVNHITATCVGDQLSFSVNGEMLATVRDDTIAAGDVALVATTYDEGGASIEYDNFRLGEPSE